MIRTSDLADHYSARSTGLSYGRIGAGPHRRSGNGPRKHGAAFELALSGCAPGAYLGSRTRTSDFITVGALP